MEIINSDLQKLLKEFRFRAKNPSVSAKAWKTKTGGKVVGITGLDVPEPLIHAAGMLPIVLLDRDEDVTLANEHVEMHQCGYIRSLVDQALKGELSYCDEFLFHDCCHIVRMLGDALHTFTDKVKKVQFAYFSPLLKYDTGRAQVIKEMGKLKKRLESLSGNEITENALAASIRLFNRQKRLLLSLYEIRRAYPGILKAVEVSHIVASGMCMPKEEHIQLLERLLTLLKEEKKKPISTNKRIVVHGSLCECCDDYVLEGIEAAGGVIVDDDLYVGSRYFNTLYDEALPPLDALLQAYWQRVSPCPTRFEERNPGVYLEELLKMANAEGIVMVVVKFCEAHDYYYFTAHRYFEAAGISELLVETEHGSAPEGQLKTRLQAFIESMEE